MLRMLRQVEGLGDLVREAGRGQRGRAPLVVFGVEEGVPVREAQGGQTVLLAVEDGDGQRERQMVLFEVVEGAAEEESKDGDKNETEGMSQKEDKEKPVKTQKDKSSTDTKSQRKENERSEGRKIAGGDETNEEKTKVPGKDESSSVGKATKAEKTESEEQAEPETEAENMEQRMKGIMSEKVETMDVDSKDADSVPGPK